MIFVCKQCGGDIADKASKRRVFCSLKCKANAQRTFDMREFRELAADGMEGKQIAAVLGITRARVHRLLKTHGLYQVWLKQRASRILAAPKLPRKRGRRFRPDKERQCRSYLLAGWKSVTTASNETATQSVSTA